MNLNNKGFTLLEVLLTVIISSLILTMIFTSYSTVIESSDKNMLKAEEYQTARLALKMIADEIDSTYIEMPYKDVESFFAFTGEDHDDGYPSDKLTFTAKVPKWYEEDSKEDDVIEVEYFISLNKDGVTKSLFRSFDTNIDGKIDADPIEFVENVYGFDIKYFTDTNEELEEWDSQEKSKDEKRLPKYVKITLSFGTDEEGLSKYTTGATINIDI